MLTLIEAISIAGDRKKQNDDAHGALGRCAWVIDGATDLGEPPISSAASDAAWLAGELNFALHEAATVYDHVTIDEEYIRETLRAASEFAREDFSGFPVVPLHSPWRSPTASALIIGEDEGDIIGLDLGDCRCFALDADDAAHAIGGPQNAANDEERAAAQAGKTADPAALLRDAGTLDRLRAKRALHNTEEPGGYWVFGLQPECADHARYWQLPLKRPAHILLCTDGLSALVDRYHAYDAAGIVRAALDKGLHELGRELRDIEAADAGGAKHPRFKPSDDATGVLLRLTEAD
jgi:serine/threonine protein phosphatase PrpC